MDLILTRQERQSQGVFSLLTGGPITLYTCEHSYQNADGSWDAKVQPGEYVCVRGPHSLDGVHIFTTYEITGVVGHTNILFHPGNTEIDSEGCVLLGLGFSTLNGMKDVSRSQEAFLAFINWQAGVERFTLKVLG